MSNKAYLGKEVHENKELDIYENRQQPRAASLKCHERFSWQIVQIVLYVSLIVISASVASSLSLKLGVSSPKKHQKLVRTSFLKKINHTVTR